nr:hypothetical protein [Tanacetum cinerariifolium]
MTWDALTVTYSSGKDKLQTFDLHVKENGLKQNGTLLEEFWIVMQGIWGEIKGKDPNTMMCPTDIAAYNKIREILRWDPLPTAKSAYAAVRKETTHQNILAGTQQRVTSGVKLTDGLDGIGLLSKGRHHPESIKLS